MAIRKLLAIVAAGEAATGVVLAVYPALVVRLLFGAEISGAESVMSRIAGISLISLGLACWPSGDGGKSPNAALRGMSSYSLLITLYLIYLGVGGDWVGKLLWPAVVVHAMITILLASAWHNDQMGPQCNLKGNDGSTS